MKLIAGITDIGTNYQIMSVFQGDEASIFQFGGVLLYEIPTIETYDTIDAALNDGKTVIFPKNLLNPLTVGDLVIQEVADEVAAAKTTARTELKQFVSNRLGSTTVFENYMFITLNNSLIDQGYVITDANREAKYLEIVNAGVQETIDNLDIYLSIKDKLDENRTMFMEYRDAVQSISAATTTEEIQTILDTYYASYS